MAEAKKKRRWIWLLVAGLVAALLLGLLPGLSSSFVRGKIEEALAERVGGEASIEELGLSWSGARLRALRVVDPGGEDVLRLDTLIVTVEPLALLQGKVNFELQGLGYELVLRQREDGSWNLHDWLDDGDDEDEDEEAPEEESETKDGDTGRLHGSFGLEEGRLVLVGRSGTTTVEDLVSHGRLAGTDAAELVVECGVVGPSGTRGELHVGAHLLDLTTGIAQAKGTIELGAEAVALSVLDPFLAEKAPGRAHEGTLSGELVGTFDASTRVAGDLRVDDLMVSIPGEEGEPPMVLRDPSVTLTVNAELDPVTLDLPDATFEVASTFLRGSIRAGAGGLAAWLDDEDETPAVFDTLEAHLLYRPEELGALLGPWLPVPISRRLSGQEEERIDVELAGSLAAPGLDALLEGMTGQATLGLARVTTTAIDVEGDVTLELTQKGTTFDARFDANGGELLLAGAFDPDATGATVHLDATTIEATSRLSPLLAIVHPAFAAVETLQRSELAGIVGCHLDLTYGGPLSKDVLAGGWDAFPTETIAGRGRFEITGARLAGAPALAEMLEVLGVDPDAELRIRPMEFVVEAGRLTYVGDWTWTISGIETTFTGSVGLDRSLDLAWNVPITEEVIEEHDFLELLKGRTIALPITGTAKNPKLEWREAVKELTTSLGPLDILEELGVDTGLGTDPDRKTSEDPATLLAQANRLWDEDKKLEAAAIYRKIRSDHKVSLVYALNRDRIKRRGKYSE